VTQTQEALDLLLDEKSKVDLDVFLAAGILEPADIDAYTLRTNQKNELRTKNEAKRLGNEALTTEIAEALTTENDTADRLINNTLPLTLPLENIGNTFIYVYVYVYVYMHSSERKI
jgi:hypothetical protein